MVYALLLLMSFEVGVGYTDFRKGEDGLWRQNAFHHVVDKDSPSYSVGIKTEHIRFGYEYLGEVESFALATASDEDYLNGPPYWPLSQWYGRGETRGLYLTYHTELWRDLFAEVGVYAYQTTWKMTIPDWRACESCEPQYLEIEHNHKDNIQYGPIVGVGWRVTDNLDLSFNYRNVQNDGDEWPSIVRDMSWNFSARVAF